MTSTAPGALLLGDVAARQPVSIGWLTLSVMLATIMQVLDGTVANVALPHMQASLSASADTITWVLTSYIVGTAVTLPIVGWLSATLGQKRVLLVSVAGFVMASALCGVASSLPAMILFRLVQGALGASLVPISLAVMLDNAPREKHGSLMAIWGAGIMVGPLAGPIVGGWLTENMNWRWVFLLNIPIGVLALAGVWLTVPERRPKRRPFDHFGFVLIAAAITSFQFFLDRGERQDWFASTEITIELLIAISCLWMFLVHTFTTKAPLFPRALFANLNFDVSLVLIFVIGVTLFSTMALLPPMLQHLYGYPVTLVGLVLSPRGAGTMLSMLLLGRIANRMDPRACAFAGLSIVAWSNYEMMGFSLDMDWWPIVTNGFIQGIGFGLITVPMNLLAFSTLPSELRPDATGLYSLVRNIGSSVGISMVTILLSRNMQQSHADLATSLRLPQVYAAPAPTDAVQGLMFALDQEVTRQATMIAYLDDFKLLFLLSICVLPLLFLVKRGERNAAAEPPVME